MKFRIKNLRLVFGAEQSQSFFDDTTLLYPGVSSVLTMNSWRSSIIFHKCSWYLYEIKILSQDYTYFAWQKGTVILDSSYTWRGRYFLGVGT
jgi:hypothetical protein